jgi:16S rRNA (cytosine967-C5)-methyltransferase
MQFSYACARSPAVDQRLAFLENSGICSLDEYFSAISWPGDHYHVRANTLKISAGRLLEQLVVAHPETSFEPAPFPPEAIRFDVRGPFELEERPMKAEVDKFSAESVMMGAPLYAPGFRSPITRFNEGDIVSMYARFKVSWDQHRHEIFCGNGRTCYPSNRIHLPVKGVVIETTESWFSTPRIQDWPEYQDGLLLDQNLPSMLATRALDPRPGDTVLDVCCGAGGKSTHLAQLMLGKGRIVAVDRSHGKIARLAERAARMDISCIQPVASKTDDMAAAVGDLHPARVLIDPPCSALGLRPRPVMDLSEKEFDNFWANQERIWLHVAPFLQRGTRIVYCTCTVTLEENELLVARILDKHGLSIVDPGFEVGHPGIEVDGISQKEASFLRRFYPADDTIGFFIATLEAT